MTEVRGIILDSTSRKLEIDLAAGVTTNEMRIVVCYRDWLAQENQPQRATTQTSISNGTTEATICDAPEEDNVSREVFFININNRDTVAADVIVFYDDGGTNWVLARTTLAANETLSYNANSGWQVI